MRFHNNPIIEYHRKKMTEMQKRDFGTLGHTVIGKPTGKPIGKPCHHFQSTSCHISKSSDSVSCHCSCLLSAGLSCGLGSWRCILMSLKSNLWRFQLFQLFGSGPGRTRKPWSVRLCAVDIFSITGSSILQMIIHYHPLSQAESLSYYIMIIMITKWYHYH